MVLLRRRPLGSLSEEGATLLGIGEVLRLDDLKLPVLLDDSEDADRINVVRGTVDEREYGCDLRHSRMLRSGAVQ